MNGCKKVGLPGRVDPSGGVIRDPGEHLLGGRSQMGSGRPSRAWSSDRRSRPLLAKHPHNLPRQTIAEHVENGMTVGKKIQVDVQAWGTETDFVSEGRAIAPRILAWSVGGGCGLARSIGKGERRLIGETGVAFRVGFVVMIAVIHEKSRKPVGTGLRPSVWASGLYPVFHVCRSVWCRGLFPRR